MKWNEKKCKLSLEPRDMKIISQCDMSLGEMLRNGPFNKRIPPAWSVLSYVMFQKWPEGTNLWHRYRTLCEMAKDTSRCYYHHWIPKSDGTLRKLSVPGFGIRRQQQFILNHILSGLPVDPHAFAYRKGIRMEDCAKPHVGQDILIHLDIEDFFGSITEDMVFRAFCEATGYPPSLCRFLARMCCFKGSLPMGAVTSPALSNVVFLGCDEELGRLAEDFGMRYTRYSDDLFFSGSKELDIEAVLRQVQTLLGVYGFRINRKKTTVRKRHHCQKVLGLTVNDHVQVNRKYRRQLIQEIYYLEKFGSRCKGAVESGDYLKYMQQLQGRLAYVLHIEPDNTQLWVAHWQLRQRIEQYASTQQ